LGPRGVVFEAIGIGVASKVEPVLGHALGAGGGREEAVDESFEGVGPRVFLEGVDFVGSRGEAGEIEGDAAN
jgi:hypothetical protein